jgi:hypothetical protein
VALGGKGPQCSAAQTAGTEPCSDRAAFSPSRQPCRSRCPALTLPHPLPPPAVAPHPLLFSSTNYASSPASRSGLPATGIKTWRPARVRTQAPAAACAMQPCRHAGWSVQECCGCCPCLLELPMESRVGAPPPTHTHTHIQSHAPIVTTTTATTITPCRVHSPPASVPGAMLGRGLPAALALGRHRRVTTDDARSRCAGCAAGTSTEQFCHLPGV